MCRLKLKESINILESKTRGRNKKQISTITTTKNETKKGILLEILREIKTKEGKKYDGEFKIIRYHRMASKHREKKEKNLSLLYIINAVFGKVYIKPIFSHYNSITSNNRFLV